MATNPMQRRARNAFLIGIVIGLIIVAVVTFVLYKKITTLKSEKEALDALQRQFYVLKQDIASGIELTADYYGTDIIRTKMNQANNFNPGLSDKKLYSKIPLKAGTILTEDMFYTEGNETPKDLRTVEINTVVLPSQLQEGEYIDIRLRFPQGTNFIVLSKKQVKQCNSDTIWLELTEDEIQTLDNAIVESYVVEGSKLSATTYAEAGMQDAAIPTYTVSADVVQMLTATPNLTEEAKNAIWTRYNRDIRNNLITPVVNQYEETAETSVVTGTDEEVSKTKQAREDYVTMLNGGN